jgi:hypothetical protein
MPQTANQRGNQTGGDRSGTILRHPCTAASTPSIRLWARMVEEATALASADRLMAGPVSRAVLSHASPRLWPPASPPASAMRSSTPPPCATWRARSSLTGPSW